MKTYHWLALAGAAAVVLWWWSSKKKKAASASDPNVAKASLDVTSPDIYKDSSPGQDQGLRMTPSDLQKPEFSYGEKEYGY